ncbi:MAG: glycosyltransferase family 4 protein [Planctomycetia bacterium]|nr:glycosyltransferase family 4 protein [Planctomycetia bacterium]
MHLNAGNLFGGIETYLLTLARFAGMAPGMEPHFGICFPGRFRSEMIATGLPTYDLGPVRISRPWTVIRARRRLAGIIKRIQPHVIIVHGLWLQLIFGPVAKRFKIPLVSAFHGPFSNASLLNRWALKTLPDLILANSKYTASTLSGSITEVPCFVCNYPVSAYVGSIKDKHSVRQELKTSEDSLVVIQVSRLERWKGQHVLIEALSTLHDMKMWECWIVGGPQRPSEEVYYQELKDLAAAGEHASRIKFLGQRSDIGDLMRAADVFCQPNVAPEPFGIVFVEALYAGLPVVTSNFGGGAEIVSPECGILTTPANVDELRQALIKLMTDSTLRKDLAATGPSRAAQLCDPETQIHALYNALSQIDVKRK